MTFTHLVPTVAPKSALGVRSGFADAPAWWFLFFIIVYVILVIKVTTGSHFNEGLFLGGYSVLITGYIFSRFVLSYLHKSVPLDRTYEPSVTFVVPAKNEQENIAETLLRFARVDYPREKIEVIAIDDGSTDRTLSEMERAQRHTGEHVARFEVVHWDKNRGKRSGMYEGAQRATHEIVIFVDSDSFIEPDAVRHLVKYFKDPKIGAVSGHTDVYNRTTNALTQMQALRYYISFKIYKAAESTFGNVTCCPGCCSAYRRAYLMEFIEEWLHQTFFGRPCTFGDDRSLTNFILRKYHAAYSEEARALTVVPDTFSKYMRQQQRWKKSWLRETFIAASFIWRKNPVAATFFYIYMFLALAGPIVFIHAVLVNPIVYTTLPYLYLLGLLLVLVLHGVYYRIHTGPRPWISAAASFWFSTIILMWQLPWALITITDNRWGTR